MRKLKFLGLASIILSLTLLSCEKDDKNDSINNKCNVSNPVEDLDWLKDEIDNILDEYSYIYMATYKGETVFIYGNCNPAANYFPVVKNCNGDVLGSARDLNDELTGDTILWRHDESKCNFQE